MCERCEAFSDDWVAARPTLDRGTAAKDAAGPSLLRRRVVRSGVDDAAFLLPFGLRVAQCRVRAPA